MRYQKLEGIIVNRHAVGDADRFLTIFTKEEGKVSVYAHGIRSVKSKRIGSLDLFSHIRFEVTERGGRRTLTHVELVDGHHDTKTKLTDISRLFQIGELIDALLPEDDPHPEVYALLSMALDNLARFETTEYVIHFKKRLLKELGYGTEDHSAESLDEYIESLLDRPLRSRRML